MNSVCTNNWLRYTIIKHNVKEYINYHTVKILIYFETERKMKNLVKICKKKKIIVENYEEI